MWSTLRSEPHRTGPNLTDEVRKAYILQYAPDGAVCRVEAQSEPEPQNDAERQYLVLHDGQPVLGSTT